MKIHIWCMLKQNDDGKESGVGETEPTKNYVELVLAPQTGPGIITNTVGESQGILLFSIECEPCFSGICLCVCVSVQKLENQKFA